MLIAAVIMFLLLDQLWGTALQTMNFTFLEERTRNKFSTIFGNLIWNRKNGTKSKTNKQISGHK